MTARRALTVVGVLLAGGALGLLTFLVAPPTHADVGPGTVSLRARCCLGEQTRLLLAPVGTVEADTHRSSLAFDARVESVDVEEVRRLTADERPDRALLAEVNDDAPDLVRRFVWRTLLFAALAGGVGVLVLPGRRWWYVPLGMAGALLVTGGLLGVAWATFDEQAFDEPTFTGPLAGAPGVIETASRYASDLGAVEGRVDALGAQISDLYAASVTDSLAVDPNEVRVLHISDVHLNPLGLEIADDLAERFEVDAVLDTGDLTTFGLPAEARIGEQVAALATEDRPYLFVPGNHDSPANREALAGVEGLVLLDGQVRNVGGVRILGVGDPTFTASNEVDDDEADRLVDEAAVTTAELVVEEQPDVLAVHSPRQAAGSLGEVPLVVAGHLHERSASEEDGTLVLVVGSTGATGLGSFTVETDTPYEAEVLRFVAGELVGVDYLTLSGTEGEFTIERTLVEPDETSAEEGAADEAGGGAVVE